MSSNFIRETDERVGFLLHQRTGQHIGELAQRQMVRRGLYREVDSIRMDEVELMRITGKWRKSNDNN